MKNIPTKLHQWQQPNNSDLDGNVYVTKNITFDHEGYLELSNSPRAMMDENIDTDFNNPAVIIFSDDYGYFVETWEEAFELDTELLGTRPQQITTSGVPSGDIQSDAVFFGGLMPVSQDTDLDYYDPAANTWTDTDISLTNTSQSQHPLALFLSLSALAVGNVNTVKLYSAPLTATPTQLGSTLTIPADFYITSMCYYNQNLYIATMNRFGGHAFMYVWNGQGTAAQSAYEVDSNIMFSICVHKGSVVCVTGNGSLLRYNGGGFDHLAAFPIFYTDRALTDEVNIGMYKNMMKSNGDILYILFSDQENQTKMTNMPGGIWCYDEKVGLYHRYSLSNSLVQYETVTTAEVNTTTDQITVTTPQVTGTEVYYRANGGTVLAGLTDETKYFVIKIDATHIQLAATKALAVAGTAIDLTGTGSNSQTLVLFPNVDFGQFFIKRTMALCTIDRPTTLVQYGTDLIWGAEVEQRTLSGGDGMMGTVTPAVESRGYLITPKIFSDDINDTFNNINLKFSPFVSELDAIIIKYRLYDDRRDTILITGTSSWKATWTSTTTFTTTQTDFSSAAVGDEVEFLRGAAGGLLAHITAISVNAGTYTVTIDETFDNYTAGDLSTVVFRNWVKWKTIVYGDTNALQYYMADQLGKEGKMIQFKIEVRGIKVRIEEFLVDNKYHLPFR